MSTIALTKDTFEDTVTKPGITLVDWWASGAGRAGCSRRSSPARATAHRHHVRQDRHRRPAGLSAAARISSIPTLMAFRDGILVFSQPGALPPRR